MGLNQSRDPTIERSGSFVLLAQGRNSQEQSFEILHQLGAEVTELQLLSQPTTKSEPSHVGCYVRSWVSQLFVSFQNSPDIGLSVASCSLDPFAPPRRRRITNENNQSSEL